MYEFLRQIITERFKKDWGLRYEVRYLTEVPNGLQFTICNKTMVRITFDRYSLLYTISNMELDDGKLESVNAFSVSGDENLLQSVGSILHSKGVICSV